MEMLSLESPLRIVGNAICKFAIQKNNLYIHVIMSMYILIWKENERNAMMALFVSRFSGQPGQPDQLS